MKRIDSRTVEFTEKELVVLNFALNEWDEKIQPREFIENVGKLLSVDLDENFIEYAIGALYDNSVHGWPNTVPRPEGASFEKSAEAQT